MELDSSQLPSASRLSLPISRFGSNHSKRMSLPAFITNRIDEGDESIEDDLFDRHRSDFETDNILARIDADKEQHDREMEEEQETIQEPETTPTPEPTVQLMPSLKRRSSLVLPAKENVALDNKTKKTSVKAVNQSLTRRGSLPGMSTTPFAVSQRANIPVKAKDGKKPIKKEVTVNNKRKSLSRPVLSTLSTSVAKSTVPPATKRSRTSINKLTTPETTISPALSPRENDVCADDVVIDDESPEMLAPLTKLPTRFTTPQKSTTSHPTVTPSPIRTKRDLQHARDQLQAYENIIAKKEDRMRNLSSSLEERLERVTRELEEEKARTATLQSQLTASQERETTLSVTIQQHLATISQQQIIIQQQQTTIANLQQQHTIQPSPVRTIVSNVETVTASPAPSFNIIAAPESPKRQSPPQQQAQVQSSSQEEEFVADPFSASHIDADPEDINAQAAFDSRISRRLSIGVPSHTITTTRAGRRLSAVPIHTAAPTTSIASRRSSMIGVASTSTTTTENRRFTLGGRVEKSCIVAMKLPGVTRDRVRTMCTQASLVAANITRVALDYDLLSGNVSMAYVQLSNEDLAQTLFNYVSTMNKTATPKYALMIPKSAK